MIKNVGSIDRVLRILVGGALIIWAIMSPDTPYIAWAWLGVIPLVTGFVGWCPIYRIFGMSTCKVKS